MDIHVGSMLLGATVVCMFPPALKAHNPEDLSYFPCRLQASLLARDEMYRAHSPPSCHGSVHSAH